MVRVYHRHQRLMLRVISLVFGLGLLLPGFGAILPAPQTAVAQTADAATPAANASPEASPVQAAGTPVPINAADQVMLSGPWRITVVSARRGTEIPSLNLTSRSERDWIVVVFDVANWSKQSAEFQGRNFGIKTISQTSGGLAPQTTADVATKLGLSDQNIDAKQTVAAGDTVRLAMVFQVASYEQQPTLTLGDDALPLELSFVTSPVPTELPPVSTLPTLNAAKVTKVLDGVTIEAGGKTYVLLGLDAPSGKECFASQSVAQLTKLADKSILVERPNGASGDAIYAWIDNGKNAPTLINQLMVADGYASIADHDGAPFAALLNEANRSARFGLSGLWANCTAPHGVEIPSSGEFQALQVDADGKTSKYAIWVPWPAQIVSLPDGGAWAFFSANTVAKDGAEGDKLIFASRYNPQTGKWSIAKPLPGGRVQFGVSAVVDQAGHVHVVYSDRKEDQPSELSVLRYITEDGNGEWTKPVAVSPLKEAGHQLSPSLTIDRKGVLHVVWQDQRRWSAADRQASVVNADIFYSEMDLNGKRTWSPAELLSVHKSGEVGSRPRIVVDNNRLVAVWSIYTTALGLNAAARVEWATRPISDASSKWSKAETLIAGRGENFGGLLLDLRADPTGGAVLVYGRRNIDTFLFTRRLPAASDVWSGDVLITFGKNGMFPTMAINQIGTTYIAYNLGEGAIVDVGITALAHDSVTPGRQVNLTETEKETQGRPVLTTDLTGSPWVLYFNQSTDGVANEVRIVRRIPVPVSGR